MQGNHYDLLCMLNLLVLPCREISIKGYVVAEVTLDQLVDLFLTRGEPIGHLLDSFAQLAHCLALRLLANTWSKLAVHGEHAMTVVRYTVFPFKSVEGSHDFIIIITPEHQLEVVLLSLSHRIHLLHAA